MSKNITVAILATIMVFVQPVFVNAEKASGQLLNTNLVLSKKGGIEWIYTGKVGSLRSNLDAEASVKLQSVAGTVYQEWTLPGQGMLTLQLNAPKGHYWLVVDSEDLAQSIYFEIYLD